MRIERTNNFIKKTQATACKHYCVIINYVVVSVFVYWQKLRCSLTFEFVVLILANNFTGYLCLSLCSGLIESTKSTPITIQLNKRKIRAFMKILSNRYRMIT